MSATNPTDVDSKLDMLISRIQSLGGGGAEHGREGIATEERPRQQPRPAVGVTPVAMPPVSMPTEPPTGLSAMVSQPRQPASSAPPAQAKPNPSEPTNFNQPMVVPCAAGFQPCRDEPWRPAEPYEAENAGLNETLVEAIIYRYLQNVGEAEGRKISEQVKLPFRMVEPILNRLKMEQNVAYKSSTATNDYCYVLTETGRNIARNHLQDCSYYGSCPVPLTHYIASVKYQTIEGQYPRRKDLMAAFHDLLINPKMLDRLGPAVASGRGMFLFGFPGNGKTSIAERVTGAFGKYVWIPRAVDIDGEILRIFDPMCHQLAMPEETGGLLSEGGFDKRWVRIERPTVIAGGELTMDMLEVQHNPESNISESSLQLKSNCGTLIIDDFGRQKMAVDALLNRWIVPLEKRYDFLNMASGKKIQVPFDQLVVFSTNLEPKDLVDDAFLRRIPYKIEITDPPEADFRKLFQIMAKVLKVPYNQACIDYLIETHYKPINRPMRMCQPRDLLLQVKNYCLYNDLPIDLKNEYFDYACDNYFAVM